MKMELDAMSGSVVVNREWDGREYTITEFLADVGGVICGVGISDTERVIKKGEKVKVQIRKYESIGELQGKAKAVLL